MHHLLSQIIATCTDYHHDDINLHPALIIMDYHGLSRIIMDYHHSATCTDFFHIETFFKVGSVAQN